MSKGEYRFTCVCCGCPGEIEVYDGYIVITMSGCLNNVGKQSPEGKLRSDSLSVRVEASKGGKLP